MTKNLLFHCYLNDHTEINESTRFSLSCLKNYIKIFDGRKIACISLDRLEEKTSIFFERDLEVFLSFDEIHYVKNDPDNRESESLISLLERVKDSKKSMTFYAHTKGSTHSLDANLKNWILSLYFFNLEEEFVKKIEQRLEQDCTTSGILKKDCRWHDPSIQGEWHYSGAFFWLCNEKFFKTDWSSFSKGRMSLESYLGQRIPTSQALSTFVERDYNFHINDSLWNEIIKIDLIGEETFSKYKKNFDSL